MTRNEDYTREFWRRFDSVLRERNTQLKELCQISDIPYKTLTGWRSKHRLPDIESLITLAESLRCSIDGLLNTSPKTIYGPRIEAIADKLSEDPKLLDAIEVIIFGGVVGQSSKSN